MKNNIISGIIVAVLGIGFSSCSEENPVTSETTPSGKLKMAFNFSHPSTRATETAFEAGDMVGLYVSKSDSPLEIAGNVVNNEKVTFNGSSWDFSRQLYWNNGNYNAYGYYPYADDVCSISDFPYSVETDQSIAASGQSLSGYEKSDFLYASAKGIEASDKPVNLLFRHIMSKISIRMIKGEDFEGELPENADVYIHNTVPSATIDLSVGIVTKNPKGVQKTIKACPAGSFTYSAIIVPQRLENRVPLIEVVMNGVSYLYESKFLFKQGIHHVVNLVIDKNPDQIKIEIGGEITDWN